MSHDCLDCGETCYCDGEDTFLDAPDDCCHYIKCLKQFDAEFDDEVGEETHG